jgi:nucleoside 2-deoxyribosyltransferase
MSRRVYCSGPLFCAEEVGAMTAIARALEGAGFDTFLPHRDGLEPYVLRCAGGALPAIVAGLHRSVGYAVFALDVYELVERCDAVVCNLNGRVPDEGTIVEASLAFAVGKPLVFYKADARAPFGGHDNPMLTSLARGGVESRLERLPDRVRRAVAATGPLGSPAPPLAEAVAAGARLAAVLAKLPPGAGAQRWTDEVVRAVLAELGYS